MKNVFTLQFLFAAFFVGNLAAQCPTPQDNLLQFSTQDDIDGLQNLATITKPIRLNILLV